VKAYRGDGWPSRDDEHTLDCPDCGSWFAGFADLAAHVTRVHATSSHAVSAQHVIDYIEERETDMKMPSASRPTPARSEKASATTIPSANREQQNSDYNPFLKSEHIGKVGKVAELVLTGSARAVDSQYGAQIVIEVKHRKSTFDWGIKLNSPNHRLLEDFVGTDTNKWRGKRINVTVRENLGRDYIAIDRPATDIKTRSIVKKKTSRKSR